ncbi:hypothetical protein QTP88_002093 [Uroleucon formosanum]
MENERDLLKKVITCDETWIFQYDPETKRQSMHWKTSASPKLKKARMSKSKLKAMLIVFFDIKGVIMTEWVPQRQTLNQNYYLQVLTTLRERVRRKRPELWENYSWILHQDNAPAHSALSVKRFLAKNRTPVLQHPPYSPDLAPCDFWLFPKLKSALKGTHFESVEAVKTKATEVLKALQEKDFQHCFNQWKIRMERCVKHGGLSAQVSELLLSLKPCIPLEFARKPRSLIEISRWKATELRLFVLYTGPVVLKKVLSKDCYSNFMALNIAMIILLSPNQNDKIDYADKLLNYFVNSFQHIYVSHYISLNVHDFSSMEFNSKKVYHRNVGSLIENITCGPQLMNLKVNDFTIKLKTTADRFVLTFGGDILTVVNIAHLIDTNEQVIIGYKFLSKQLFYENPLKSSKSWPKKAVKHKSDLIQNQTEPSWLEFDCFPARKLSFLPIESLKRAEEKAAKGFDENTLFQSAPKPDASVQIQHSNSINDTEFLNFVTSSLMIIKYDMELLSYSIDLLKTTIQKIQNIKMNTSHFSSNSAQQCISNIQNISESVRRKISKIFDDSFFQNYSFLGFKEKSKFSGSCCYVIRKEKKFTATPDHEISTIVVKWLAQATNRISKKKKQLTS